MKRIVLLLTKNSAATLSAPLPDIVCTVAFLYKLQVKGTRVI